ncbi:MAG: hypothetical protein E7592_05145 [Ruminococcaceae bacterium]|nr:hypothetical protein [Oscillospiraceae bacterium]
MSKTLSTILTIFKVVKIVAKVIFILCIIGGAGCLVGLATLPLLDLAAAAEFIAEEGIELGAAYLACITGAVTCAGEAVFAFFAERYFGHVLESGTPFTFDGAKESFRLGVTSIIISVVVSVVVGLALAVAQLMSSGGAQIDVDMSVSLTTGLFFMFMSLIFKYGAEVKAAVPEEPEQKEEIIF